MNFPKLSFFMTLVLIAGCGPGFLDYSKKIRGTELIYIDANSLTRIIVKSNSNGEQETIVGSSILNYRVESGHVFGARQVVRHYRCEQTRSDVEITDRIEFFVIKIFPEEAQYSSVSFDDFSEFESYLETIQIDDQTTTVFQPSSLEDRLLAVSSLGECKAPQLVSME